MNRVLNVHPLAGDGTCPLCGDDIPLVILSAHAACCAEEYGGKKLFFGVLKCFIHSVHPVESNTEDINQQGT